MLSGIPATQPDAQEQLTGPATKVAYKDGQPTPAAHAFAKKAGVDVSKLQTVTTPKGEYLTATVTNKGKPAAQVLAELLPKEIASIYWPKNMYWRAGKPERFVRPVRWIVAMLDGEIIPLEFGGIKAGKQSRGHRILGPEQVSIAAPAQYVEVMQGAHVTASTADREYKIRKALDAATRTVPGARWREDAELLKTVVNLTEWPSAILGNFDKQYLSLPEEVLVTVMRDHQKYFAVEDASGKLAPHFLAVLNTDGDPDGLIRHGNERVLRARFNDARFFWDTDQKTPLVNRVEMLKAVTFQKDLGSYAAKAERVVKLAEKLCAALAKAGLKVDAKRGPAGGAAGQDRSHHRTGERIYRIAGRCRRALCEGAGHCRKPSPTPFTTSTSPNRRKIPRRARWKARCSRSPTKPTALRECLRWGWFLRDRKIRLRCGGRRMES